MPNLEAPRIPIWITSCDIFPVHGSALISTDHHGNCILRIPGGKCRAFYKDEVISLTDRDVVMLGRDTSIRLEPEQDQPVECLALRYAHTFSNPQVDLNHLCTSISLVDAFYGRKKRFCVIQDHDSIYKTLGDLQYEWNRARPERDFMLKALFQVLLISLARSFHANTQAVGIQYLSKASTYVQQHYGDPLTLEEIAAHAGISRSYLTQLFRLHMNRSVVEYIQAVRCDRAAFLLGTTRFPIIDIAIETGFNNRQHFARTFSRIYGIPPAEYRREHRQSGDGSLIDSQFALLSRNSNQGTVS